MAVLCAVMETSRRWADLDAGLAGTGGSIAGAHHGGRTCWGAAGWAAALFHGHL